MILCIAELLDTATLSLLRDAFARGELVDGRTTAGWHARGVKQNTQLVSGADTEDLRGRIQESLARHEVFSSACLPNRFGPMLFSRYAAGMSYGTHVDDALMGTAGNRIRSDISFTLFLTDPGSYEGGELIIESPGGEQDFKLPAGSAIIYPSTTLHRVEPVITGERLVIAGWLQSHVRSSDQREILFELDQARREIFRDGGKSATFDLLAKGYANLLRMWAET
jgi:PKHD-type hydroxylase